MTSVFIFSRDAEWYGGVVNFVALLTKCLDENIQFTSFKIGRRKGIIGIALRPLFPLLDAIKLAGMLRRTRYDAYHVNPSLNLSSLLRDGLFMLVLRLMGARNVIVSFHGWDEPVARSIKRHGLYKRLFRAVFGYADHTLVLAGSFRSWLIDTGFDAGRVHLFTTMFDSEEFAGTAPHGGRDVQQLLFLSRLVREKGMYELLDALRLLASDYPELHLVFAGNGPEEEPLKQRAAETGLDGRVRFAGYVRGAEKAQLMRESGIFVFPTYYGEGCPVSLLEAMAAGMAVVTTPVGGIPHIITGGVNGILLESVSPETIAAALRSLLAEPGKLRAMSERNSREAWEKYSAPVVTRIFERYYRGEIVHGHGH